MTITPPLNTYSNRRRYKNFLFLIFKHCQGISHGTFIKGQALFADWTFEAITNVKNDLVFFQAYTDEAEAG